MWEGVMGVSFDGIVLKPYGSLVGGDPLPFSGPL